MVARLRRLLAGVALVLRIGIILRIGIALRIGIVLRIDASWVLSRRRDSRDGRARLIVRNQVGAGRRRDVGRSAGVQHALNVVIDHAEEEG